MKPIQQLAYMPELQILIILSCKKAPSIFVVIYNQIEAFPATRIRARAPDTDQPFRFSGKKTPSFYAPEHDQNEAYSTTRMLASTPDTDQSFG